ncbi:unnamed protein product [Owenia fusiformis]|uniref:EGF-like domain-containing protein n=1 Tax=Owenia fusiformis TaxID=6347 RepID=A0A8S4Q9Z7_OWEFU|nr:unnamed protein product [Owenia fusiformis]
MAKETLIRKARWSYPGCVLSSKGPHRFSCSSKRYPCTGNAGLCQNGGTCVKVGKWLAKCQCTADYIGDRCEHEKFNPCLENPCLNGADCNIIVVNQIAVAKCDCMDGWMGRICDIACEVNGACGALPCCGENRECNAGTCRTPGAVLVQPP